MWFHPWGCEALLISIFISHKSPEFKEIFKVLLMRRIWNGADPTDIYRQHHHSFIGQNPYTEMIS